MGNSECITYRVCDDFQDLDDSLELSGSDASCPVVHDATFLGHSLRIFTLITCHFFVLPKLALPHLSVALVIIAVSHNITLLHRTLR